MKKHLGLFAAAAVVFIGLIAYSVLYQVNELTDIVLVQRFGRTRVVHRGDTDAGLHAKWLYPFEQVHRYDSRVHVFDDTYNQVQTTDKQNLLVTVFCAWRIHDPEKFYTKVKYVDEAQAQIRNRLRYHKDAIISQRPMSQLVNTDPEKMKLEEIEKAIYDELAPEMLTEYGVKVEMVGIKSLGLPEDVSEAVIDSMIEERNKEAEKFRAAGDAQKVAITSRAEAARKQILVFARRKAYEIRSEGDRAAREYYEKFQANEALAMYLRELEAMRESLKSGDSTMILDGSRLRAVRFLREGPSLPTTQPAPTPANPNR